MKKKFLFYAVYLLAAIVVIINIAYFIHDSFFDSINVLPVGEFLYSSMSPSGNETVSVYKVTTNRGYAIRGEESVVESDGTIRKHNIFWQLDKNSAIVGWINDNIVSINGEMIDITTDKYYDSRKDFLK